MNVQFHIHFVARTQKKLKHIHSRTVEMPQLKLNYLAAATLNSMRPNLSSSLAHCGLNSATSSTVSKYTL